MARGGKREGAGRRKQERPTNASVAGKVLAKARAEQLWLSVIELECNRLGIDVESGVLLEKVKTDDKGNIIDGPDYQGKFSIIPLTNVLRYLEDRAYGRPVDTVNHVHDKPLEVNMTVSLAETIQKARKRAEAK
jgi:hypothetical protein